MSVPFLQYGHIVAELLQILSAVPSQDICHFEHAVNRLTPQPAHRFFPGQAHLLGLKTIAARAAFS